MAPARALLLSSSLLLAACHNDWNEVYAECVSSGRCVSDAGAVEADAGAAPVVRVDRANIMFSDVVVTEQSPAEQLIITNEGPGELASLRVDLQAQDFAHFAVSSQCTGPLLQGATCSVTLTFSPLDVGPRTTQLVITPAGQPAFTVPLIGAGLPALEFVPTSLAFPDTSVGSQSRRSLTLVNHTRMNQSPTWGSTGGLFVKDTSCQTISPGLGCEFLVTFSPVDDGSFSGTLTASIGPPSFTAVVALAGNGLELGSLRLTPARPFDDAVADAGSVHTTPFTLSNMGATAIGPITLSVDPAGSVFSVLDAGCVALNAGASCTGELAFSPTSIGEFNATLTANAGLGGVATTALYARGAGTYVAQVRVTTSATDRVITDGGFQCSGSCDLPVYVVPPAYPTVVFEAQRGTTRSGFDGWSGDCAGHAPSCPLVMDRSRSLTASFGRLNLAFITSTTVTGNFGGLDGGDAFCERAARAGGLPGTYRAWISTLRTNAVDRLPDAGGWIRVDDLPFASSRAALTRGEVLYPLLLDQHGAPVDAGLVWTSTGSDGGFAANGPNGNCRDWTSNSLFEVGVIGLASGGSTLWTQTMIDRDCGTSQRLYCFQVDHHTLTPPLALPPGANVMFLSRVGLLDGGLPALDARCSQEGQAAGLGPAFNALVGGAMWSPASRINATSTGPLYRPDGVMLRPSLADLRNAEVDLLASPNVMADGTFVTDSNARVAIGSLGVLLPGSDHCSDWTSSGFAETVRTAEPRMSSARNNAVAGGGYFRKDPVDGCPTPMRVYCVPR